MTSRRLAAALAPLALLALLAAAREEDSLPGSWHVQSMGGRALGAKNDVVWKIDDNAVEVSLNGQRTSRSTYKLGKDGDHAAIWLSPEGKPDPDRMGWYELRGTELRLQVGKQMPTAWEDAKTMVLVRGK